MAEGNWWEENLEKSSIAKKLNDDLVINHHVYGWMGGSKSHFKDCLQQSKCVHIKPNCLETEQLLSV